MALNSVFAGKDFALEELYIFLSFGLCFYYMNIFDEIILK